MGNKDARLLTPGQQVSPFTCNKSNKVSLFNWKCQQVNSFTWQQGNKSLRQRVTWATKSIPSLVKRQHVKSFNCNRATNHSIRVKQGRQSLFVHFQNGNKSIRSLATGQRVNPFITSNRTIRVPTRFLMYTRSTVDRRVAYKSPITQPQ